jgi:hypothetical protein
MYQSETMKLQRNANTETVSNSALKKQVATAQAEVAIQKMRIKNLQTENEHSSLIFGNLSGARASSKHKWQH